MQRACVPAADRRTRLGMTRIHMADRPPGRDIGVRMPFCAPAPQQWCISLQNLPVSPGLVLQSPPGSAAQHALAPFESYARATRAPRRHLAEKAGSGQWIHVLTSLRIAAKYAEIALPSTREACAGRLRDATRCGVQGCPRPRILPAGRA
eukprot:350500-Chlamydomonas_euryale.AAC.17